MKIKIKGSVSIELLYQSIGTDSLFTSPGMMNMRAHRRLSYVSLHTIVRPH